MLVSDIMARTLEFIAPDDTVQQAAIQMAELDVGALPVGSPEDLQGIITDRDILIRLVTEGHDPTRVRVREAMSRTVFTCRETDSLATAMDIMGSYHIRRLPVVDEAGTVTGWLTLSDISRRLLLDTGAVQEALKELSAASPGAGSAAPPDRPASQGGGPHRRDRRG
jgi:CBS domain-containing protein